VRHGRRRGGTGPDPDARDLAGIALVIAGVALHRRIGLGMMSCGDPGLQGWALREDEAEPIVRHAADAGIIFFDTADMYSGGVSEQITWPGCSAAAG
jgi:predicted oxidoreductase